MAAGVISIQGREPQLLAPFVSHLGADMIGSELILSWIDAPESADVIYQIHRHNEEITAENLERTLRIAVVASGIESFTDTPPKGTPWWYAVVTVYEGNPLDLIIPWRNTLGNPVTVHDKLLDFQDAAAVRSLSANVDGSIIYLNFETDRPGREITVYRNPEPIESPDDLDHAVAVGRSTGTAHSGYLEDSPLPEYTWYYAAVDTMLFDSGNPQWFQKAARSGPVNISDPEIHDSGIPVMRPAPLPLLRISRSFVDGRSIPEINGELPVKKTLSAEASASLSAALDPNIGNIWLKPEPTILEVDKAFSENRRQLLLKEILEGSFSDELWKEAETELFSLSATNGMEGSTRARIQFYRGQCQYFLNDPYSAFLSFLAASDFYYLETRKWMLKIYSDLTPVS